MKKYLIFSIALLFPIIGVHAANYICSDTTHIGTTIQFVYCAEDYFPKYNPTTHQLIEDPVTFLIDLGDSSINSINGHVELTSLDLMDFCIIRETAADTTTIRDLGVFSGVQDIQLYTQRTRYIAVDIYCFMGAVSSTSGITLNISPIEQTSIINATIADKLGIGTADPSTSLEVVGDVKIRTTGTKGMTISPKVQQIDFSTNTDKFCFDKPIQSSTGIYTTSSSSNLTLQTYNTPRMTILKDNGYVGIGTTEPQAMLDVRGRLHVQNDDGWVDIGPVNWGFMHFYTDRPRFYFNKPIFVQGGIISSIEHVNLQLQTFHTTRLTIQDGTGNVGIGIDTPLYKLDVVGKIHASDSILCTVVKAPHAQISQLQAIGVTSSNLDAYTIRARSDVLTVTAPTLDCTGKIRANEIIVNSGGGADFVFEKDYNLRSLDEVNSFIQEHQHLPEIPSAQQMQEDGMSVDQMVVKLLQKIEELTLYTIQQEERIKDLEQKQTPK